MPRVPLRRPGVVRIDPARKVSDEDHSGVPMTSPLTIHEHARVVGHYYWIERRLFELTGSWASQPGSAPAQVLFAEASAVHARHADLWRSRFAVLDGWNLEEHAYPPSPGIERLLSAIDGVDPADPTERLKRLVGYRDVLLTRLRTVYLSHHSQASPVCDAPTIDSLGRAAGEMTIMQRRADSLLGYIDDSSARQELEALFGPDDPWGWTSLPP